MQLRRFALCLLFAGALAGCKTDYQASDESRLGYSDRQIGADMWEIQIRVSEHTDKSAADAYFNKRAAELCAGRTPYILKKEEGQYDALVEPGTAVLYMPKMYNHNPMVTGTIQCQ